MKVARREFVGALSAALAMPLLGIGDARAKEGVFAGAVLIKGGRLVDPQNSIDDFLDVHVSKGRVVEVGRDLKCPGAGVLDATGAVVAPGFIDILSDNSHNPKRTYLTVEKFKVTDGVTSSLQLHGGSANVGGFKDIFERKPHLTNYGVAAKVMRIVRRYEDLAGRKRAVRRCLRQGALAVAHSIEYAPVPTAELDEYGRIAAKFDVPFVLHLRHSSFEKELDGVEEAIGVALRTGCRVHLAHLHSTGATWHMAEAVERVNDARDEGARITACVYPYTYWATYLGSRRFGPGWRERYGLDYSDLRLVGSGEALTEERFEELREKTFALAAVPEGTMSEEGLLLALRQPWMMISSDGGIEKESAANNHPRGAGCFATGLRLCMDNGFSLSEAVAKMTSLPASLLAPACSQMRRRGVLSVGSAADLVVFDPETVDGGATVENPCLPSKGILHVLVGGEVTLRGCSLTGQNPGEWIGRQAAQSTQEQPD